VASIPTDQAGHFPDLKTAQAYLSDDAYHADRLRALRRLAAQIPQPKSVIDFGCGDGMYFRDTFGSAQIVGVDLSAAMIELASQNLGQRFRGVVGGAQALESIQPSFDLGLAMNVLGYLDDAEVCVFYTQMARLIKPGGHLMVMYGNELFDMFALNSGTAAFYRKHFDLDVAELLTEGKAPQHQTAVRKNPLSFAAEIRPYGFLEVAQAYSQWHTVPPGIGNRQADLSAARLQMRDHGFDANALPPAEQWKAMLRCSIFVSLAVRE
jgi:SAM-dependent methyltransferase